MGEEEQKSRYELWVKSGEEWRVKGDGWRRAKEQLWVMKWREKIGNEKRKEYIG